MFSSSFSQRTSKRPVPPFWRPLLKEKKGLLKYSYWDNLCTLISLKMQIYELWQRYTVCNHHRNHDTECYHHSQNSCMPLFSPVVSYHAAPWYLLVWPFVIVLLWVEFHINCALQYLSVCIWLLSFCIMLLRSIHVLAMYYIFLLIAE